MNARYNEMTYNDNGYNSLRGYGLSEDAAAADPNIAIRGTPKSASSSNNITLTFDTGEDAPVEGDVAIIFGGGFDAAGHSMVTAGYTPLATVDDTVVVFGFYKKMGATPDLTAVITGTGDGFIEKTASCVILSGVHADVVDQTAVEATGSGAPNPGAITTLTDGAWVLALGGSAPDDDSSRGEIAGYTLIAGLHKSSAGSGATHEGVYKLKASAGVEDPGAWSLWSGGWSCNTIAIKPA